jgi:hypothetical protein
MGKLTGGQWFEIVFWTGFATAAYVLSFQFDRDVQMYRFGAAAWPRAVILLILAAAVGQLVADVRARKAAAAAGALEDGYFRRMADEHGAAFFVRMGITLALPLAYAALLQNTGYYFTTPFFLAAYLYITGEHRIKWLIIVPLAIYVVITFIFTRLLYVGLPVGYWPGFYDLGNWIVVLIR